MTKNQEIYKCEKCGNTVLVIDGKKGQLVCCGAPMTLLEAKSADSATEKHVPVVEKADGGVTVTIGSTLHPMTEEHSIVCAGIVDGSDMAIHWFKPGDAPKATFKNAKADAKAVEYCNVHGLWTNKK